MTIDSKTYNPGYTMECPGCRNQFRVEALGVPLAGLPKHCPYCGNVEGIKRGIDNERDYWYHLAASFGFPRTVEGATLIRKIYDMWDTAEYASFRDFMESFNDT